MKDKFIETIKLIKLGWLSLGFWGAIFIFFIMSAGSSYMCQIFFKPMPTQYYVLFSFVGVTLSFAAISFNASKSLITDQDKTKIYFDEEGKSFLQASLCFSKAILIRYVFDAFLGYRTFFVSHKMPYGENIMTFVLVVLAVYGMTFFLFGFTHAVASLVNLEKLLKSSEAKGPKQ